jgi:hypothetical protein
MAASVARKLPLCHPAEIPTFILMMVLNLAILAVLIDFLVSAALIPPGVARHELGDHDPRGRGDQQLRRAVQRVVREPPK